MDNGSVEGTVPIISELLTSQAKVVNVETRSRPLSQASGKHARPEIQIVATEINCSNSAEYLQPEPSESDSDSLLQDIHTAQFLTEQRQI